MKITWSANWDDDLGGSPDHGDKDVLLAGIADKVKFEFEQTFMFYLPRICEHCLNPSCAASCPSGAIYKRSEDGIVLVDQDRCRGWRMCVSGCPYKKIYFNHRTGKAEKCTFCFPRIEVGIPTVCSETCVGRLRYIGLMLYDADRVAAGRVHHRRATTCTRRSATCSSTRTTRRSSPAAERAGHPRDWIEAAQTLAGLRADQAPTGSRCRCTRSTARCRWSGTSRRCRPSSTSLRDTGHDAEDHGNLFGAIDALRIPVEYLAELFTAGDLAPVDRVPAHAGGDALLHARHQPRPRPATSPSRPRSA